ncbi:MAG: hypothetical protein GWP11_05770 [Proteobacteria bacterium]|nr:hypothetical protein [Pseudomonadota bacterium]
MGEVQAVQGLSANLKKAVLWLGETASQHPERQRADIVREAQLRFDLTPRECEFLNSNFNKITSDEPR